MARLAWMTLLVCALSPGFAMRIAMNMSGSCHTVQPGDQCYDAVRWAVDTGFKVNPKWYPGLSATSSFEEFQQHFYKTGTCHTAPCWASAPQVPPPERPADEHDERRRRSASQRWSPRRRATAPSWWPEGHTNSHILIRNRCPFDVKAIDGGANLDQWQTITVKSGSDTVVHKHQCTVNCRIYFAPANYSGTPGKYTMGPVEVLGVYEYSKARDDSISPDISYIGGIGVPMTAQCSGQPVYGCTDGGYGGWDDFQRRIEKYCPGELKTFENSNIKYCCPGQHGGVAKTRYARKWDVGGAFADARTSMSRSDPQSLAFCQPWSEAENCAHVARGSHKCKREEVCRGEDEFYRGYDMRTLNSDAKWKFNGYAAFVHTLCGVYAGFAFPADDRGAGMREGQRMKYASNRGFGCRHPEIELCPAGSAAWSDSTGFTYPPPSPPGGSGAM